MVSRIFSAFLMEQLGWPGTRVPCAFASPFSTSFPRHLVAPRDPITLWVPAEGLPRSLPLGRAVPMREPAITSGTASPWPLGTAGIGEGAVGAEGNSKRDSLVRGKEAPARSVTNCCVWCSQCEHQKNPVRRNCFQGETLQVVSSKTHTLGCSPLRKTCQNLAWDL